MEATTNTSRNEIAYFYPAPYWHAGTGDWIKTLLLFFDGISILLPVYMGNIHRIVDETLAAPLDDLGLLRVLRPEDFVDQKAAEDLATSVVDLITAGVFDNLPTVQYYAELSRSRMGWSTDAKLSDWLVEELIARDLAKPTEDGVSVPLHPVVRTTILVLLAQQARSIGIRMGIDLHPVTDQLQPVSDLVSVLSQANIPSSAHVVALDLETVSVDLSLVPLDDVMEFRESHGAEFRAYSRNLRSFASELAMLEPEERRARIIDRQEELADTAHDLRRTVRKKWFRPFGKASLGLAGAAWNVASGDPIGALISAGSAMLESAEPRIVSAYSYLLSIERSFMRS